MPCTSGLDYENTAKEKLKAELDNVTRLLCFMCGQIELGTDADMTRPEYKEVWHWWQEHKTIDESK